MEDKYLRRIDITNRSKRLPVCFCIDTSHSMDLIVEGLENVKDTGNTIFTDQRTYKEADGGITLMDKLNEGLANFYKAICDDEIAASSCESAIVTFNDRAEVYEEFSLIEDKNPPRFTVKRDSNTNVSSAIRMALDLLEKQKQYYKANKINHFQPWLVLFTDGLPSDDTTLIKRELKELQEGPKPKLAVYTMALSDDKALLNALRGFSIERPIASKDPKVIRSFFNFLKKSVSVVAAGGERPKIPENFF